MSQIKLKIDYEFKSLIRALTTKERLQLEDNILADGCRDPITTWRGYIVDGHNRYEICTRHNIPFQIREMEFDCREAAIAWICANQLGRRNISEETRKYLIGMQYQTEKLAASKRNARGVNQYTSEDHVDEFAGMSPEAIERQIDTRTAYRIADENHISHATVQKYAVYSKALEDIRSKEPSMAKKILSGKYKISHKNILELAKRTPEELKRVSRNIDRDKPQFVKYKRTRTVIGSSQSSVAGADDTPIPSVKDMPKYDPDAEINSLSLTIPSWVSSMERTEKVADFSKTSSSARYKLAEALESIINQAQQILLHVKEDKDNG